MSEIIRTKSGGYLVNESLNSGVYGKVFRCTKLDTQEVVAVKIVKKNCAKVAKSEYKMLKKLKHLDPDRNNLVRFIERFKYKGHICFAFEPLEQTLFDYLSERNFRPLPVCRIRLIAQQLLVALQALHSNNVTHTDIKLDNIMFANHQTKPFRVKLIDFGLALKTSNLQKGAGLQAIGYRAPEVILGLPVDESIDMWSVGCVLAALFTGRNLYSPVSEYEVLRTVVQLQGLPQYNLEGALYVDDYFKPVKGSEGYVWQLKEPHEFYESSNQNKRVCDSVSNLKSLDELPRLHPLRDDPLEVKAFIDLLKKMLNTNPKKRITPSNALKHEFFSKGELFLGANDLEIELPQSSNQKPKAKKTSKDKNLNVNEGRSGSVSPRKGFKPIKIKVEPKAGFNRQKSRAKMFKQKVYRKFAKEDDASPFADADDEKNYLQQFGDFFSSVWKCLTCGKM